MASCQDDDDHCPMMALGSPINNPKEDAEARKSWEHYQDLYLNFFLYFSANRFESPYYTSLWHFFSGLIYTSIGQEYQDKWSLFDTYLTNIELIPYHSEGISLPSHLSEDQLNYLTTRFKNSVNFIIKHRPKLFVFNGNPWYVLLIKHRLIDDYEKFLLCRSLTFISLNYKIFHVCCLTSSFKDIFGGLQIMIESSLYRP